MSLALALVVALAPAWRLPGSPFDEGFLLAYPHRVLDGDWPHRDFESFHGPATPVLLAGAFLVAPGDDQDVERSVGLLYRLMVVLSLAGMALAIGRITAVAAGGISVLLLVPTGFPAHATIAALGAALLAVALLGRRTPRAAVAAGAAGGLAVLFRVDFGLAMLAGALPYLSRDRGSRRPFAAGLAPALALLAVHAAVVGPDRISKLVSDLRASGPGRRLPVDLAGTEPGRMLAATLLAIACVLATAAIMRRRGRALPPAPLAAAALSAGLLPYAISRLDYMHVSAALIPALAALVMAAAAVVPPPRRARTAVAGAALTGLTLLWGAPGELRGPLRVHAAALAGQGLPVQWAPLRVGDRSFGVTPAHARTFRPILEAAERERLAGARTLLVGPGDLRRAYMNDVFLYYLLDGLDPSTYYMELNPLTANRPGSGFAGDVARADIVILNPTYDRVRERNHARWQGPDLPNVVLRRRFCTSAESRGVRLLRRCRGFDQRASTGNRSTLARGAPLPARSRGRPRGARRRHRS